MKNGQVVKAFENLTMKVLGISSFVFFFAVCGMCDDNTMTTIATDEEVVSSCTLAVKINALPVATNDEAGRAKVVAYLFDKNGNPRSGYEVQMSASWGTFQCDSLIASADDRSCFTTNQDGKAIVYLTNIPFNSPVKIKANCTCGDYSMYASGTVAVNKKTFRKK